MKKSKLFLLATSLFVALSIPALSVAGDESATQVVKSSAITAEVKTKLMANPDIKSLHISVTTDKSVVTLKGSVESEDQKKTAASLAKEVKGVKSVNNKLVIHKPKAKTAE